MSTPRLRDGRVSGPAGQDRFSELCPWQTLAGIDSLVQCEQVMTKIIVVREQSDYALTVIGPEQAGWGRIPRTYSAADLPAELVRLGVNAAEADRAATVADNGLWEWVTESDSPA